MTPIENLPNLDWSEIAKAEIELTGSDLIRQSSVAYQLGHAAIAGLVYFSFTSPPLFWFALARGVSIRDLIDFRAKRELIPVGAFTMVDIDHERSERFALFYGFEDTGQIINQLGHTYKIYRRA